MTTLTSKTECGNPMDSSFSTLHSVQNNTCVQYQNVDSASRKQIENVIGEDQYGFSLQYNTCESVGFKQKY